MLKAIVSPKAPAVTKARWGINFHEKASIANTALTAAAAASVSPHWAFTATAGAALSAWSWRKHATTATPFSAWLRTGLTMSATAWATWATHNPFCLENLAVMSAGALGFTLLQAPSKKAQAAYEEKTESFEAFDATKLDALKWCELAKKATGIAFIPEAAKEWGNGYGINIKMRVPDDNTSSTSSLNAPAIKLKIQQLAKLPTVCDISFTHERADASTVIMSVQLRDAMEEVHNIDLNLETPWSINNPVPIGVQPDGTVVTMKFLDDIGIIVGSRGSGKTMLLTGIMQRMLFADDAIVWVMDPNGGGVAQAWLQQVAVGRVETMPIDWVASTPDECELMVTAAYDIILNRKRTNAAEQALNNEDKIRPSKEMPAIVIFMDESAELFNQGRGNAKVKEMAEAIVATGRASRVGVIFTSLRGTVDCIPSFITSQSQDGQTVFLRPQENNKGEVAYTLGWGTASGIPSMDGTIEGAFVMNDSGKIRHGRTLFTTPNNSLAVIKAREALGADTFAKLDEESAKVAGYAYTYRWLRHALEYDEKVINTMYADEYHDKRSGTVLRYRDMLWRVACIYSEDLAIHLKRVHEDGIPFDTKRFPLTTDRGTSVGTSTMETVNPIMQELDDLMAGFSDILTPEQPVQVEAPLTVDTMVEEIDKHIELTAWSNAGLAAKQLVNGGKSAVEAVTTVRADMATQGVSLTSVDVMKAVIFTYGGRGVEIEALLEDMRGCEVPASRSSIYEHVATAVREGHLVRNPGGPISVAETYLYGG